MIVLVAWMLSGIVISEAAIQCEEHQDPFRKTLPRCHKDALCNRHRWRAVQGFVRMVDLRTSTCPMEGVRQHRTKAETLFQVAVGVDEAVVLKEAEEEEILDALALRGGDRPSRIEATEMLPIHQRRLRSVHKTETGNQGLKQVPTWWILGEAMVGTLPHETREI